ncbi:MAG: hypothetical protein Q8P12_00290 [bacterium]|nr:hypothetical protein [bacterium]
MGWKDRVEGKKSSLSEKLGGGGAVDWMKRGAEAAEVILREQKERHEAMGNRFVPELWLKDGEEVLARFESSDPIVVWVHTVPRGNNRFDKLTCPSGDAECDCSLGEAGYKRSPQFVFRVIDRRKYKNKQGKTFVNTVKVLRLSERAYRSLRLNTRKTGIIGREVTIIRDGEGINTSYQYDPGEKEPMSSED